MRHFVLLISILLCASAAATELGRDAAMQPQPEHQPQPLALGGFAHVSKRVLADLFHRDVKLNQVVTETILNMTTRGTAQIDCKIGLDLIPNPNSANLRITMTGHAVMNDVVGQMRNIRIYSTSHTSINGYKDVFFDPQGLRLAPTRADCLTSIQVHDIAARLRLVERIAWRRVGQMQSQAERAAGQRASRRAEQQLEAEAGKPLSQVHHEYVDNVYEPLVRQNAFPDARLSTTGEHLSIRFLSRAAPDENNSDSIPRPAYDLALGLSDWYVNQIATPMVGGKTHSDRRFADFMQTITGKTPRQLWVHSRADAWTVTATKQLPVIVSFADDVASVVFRIDRATRGDQTLNRPVDISAKYTLEITSDGPRLLRVGDLAVEFADAPRGTSDDPIDIQFRDFLRRKFSGVFLSEIYFDGLMPPEGGSWGKLRRLNLKQLTAQKGWLALGYELAPTAAPATMTVQNPVRRR
jgi:hypothetical protein